MATIYDVARRASVSAATVSRVLNNRDTVDPEMARRVHAAVAELGYFRNGVARNLRRSQTTLWAVIISDIGNPFFTSMVRGIEDVAQAAGYSVVLCNSDEDLAKEAAYISAAATEQMAGVIISPASERSTDLDPLLSRGTPVVTVDRTVRGAGVDTVLVDNKAGATDATSHLITEGYERIGCITGPRGVTTANRRLKGYEQALRDGGRELDPSLVRRADFRERGGFEAMASLLESSEPPEAVFVANNLMTVGALESLVRSGRRVPQDVGLVGFDDIPWADLVRPSLSTVAQPTYDVGQTAGNLLAERIEVPERQRSRISLPTTLHVRNSSHRSRRGGRRTSTGRSAPRTAPSKTRT